MNIDLSIKGDVEVLRLQPQDTVVITIRGEIGPEVFADLRDSLSERFAPHRVIIFANGVAISVLREEIAA